MSNTSDQAPNIAIYCDYENVALGVRDAKYDRFDIKLALQRLLDKGNVVVKKAYCDWDRYKSSRRGLHESGFEMIEIPHVSISGKNSADIRLVVDALDLCYTKRHVDLFVIISGDSDFSPLVSKLRENNKKVIGLGVKNSTSDLLVENCDEFIYYDDLVRNQRSPARRQKKSPAPAGRVERENGGRGASRPPAERRSGQASASQSGAPASPAAVSSATVSSATVSSTTSGEEGEGEEGSEATRLEALEAVLDTVESLFHERDDNLWGSMVKQTLKRKRPHFNENYHGYRSFNQLLEDAARREMLKVQKDEKSGGYVIVGFGPKA